MECSGYEQLEERLAKLEATVKFRSDECDRCARKCGVSYTCLRELSDQINSEELVALALKQLDKLEKDVKALGAVRKSMTNIDAITMASVWERLDELEKRETGHQRVVTRLMNDMLELRTKLKEREE